MYCVSRGDNCLPTRSRSWLPTPTTPSKPRPGGWKYDRRLWPDPDDEFGQHFLLTKKARNVDQMALLELSEEDAYGLFCSFRWSSNGGKPFCPKCSDLDPYSIRRRRFRCSEGECMREFSVTSGTVFHSRKLAFKKLLVAIWDDITAVKASPHCI